MHKIISPFTISDFLVFIYVAHINARGGHLPAATLA